MKILLSTAKTMNFTRYHSRFSHRMPLFIDKAAKIASLLKKMSSEEIQKKMKLSPSLANETYGKFSKWNAEYSGVSTNHALFAFTGTVFEKINPQTFNDDEIMLADKRLRIICGLYGMLRPLDEVVPYRLEMSLSLKPDGFRSLSDFWKDTLTSFLQSELAEDETPYVINLASAEFTKAVDLKALNVAVITPVFKELKAGTYRTIAVFAKQLRGEMIRWIITRSVENPTTLKEFSCNGYEFDFLDSLSGEMLFVKKI